MRTFLLASLVSVSLVAAFAACVGDDPATAPSSGDAGTTTTPPAPPPSGADASDNDASSCSKTVCGGACVDTSTSKDHCGACGHACGGGDCTAGVCQPVVVATNVTQPLGVAAVAGSVFWYRNNAVEKCPATGCTGTPTTITTDRVGVSAGQPGGTTIVTDGNRVAWIATDPPGGSGNGLNVFACSVTGCNGFLPTAATGFNDTPSQIAVYGNTIFGTQRTGAQFAGPIATLALTPVAGTVSDVPSGVAADANNIYWVGTANSAAGVDRCTRTNCAAATRLFNGAKYVAVGGGYAVATSAEGIKLCAVTGCGGTASVLSASDNAAAAIAANDAFVVWANSGSAGTADGAVRACALPDCKGGPRTIATAQAHPVSVTIADGFVYWANNGTGSVVGSIWRAAL